MWKKIVLIISVIAVLSGSFITCAGYSKAEYKVINIKSGSIRGTVEDGVSAFLGIPYAAPPTGELRWREPQANSPWDGTRDCTKYGPACPQPKTIFYNVDNMNEDCLNLNVWTPSQSSGDKLPVMVWIHGGSFTTGAGSLRMYEGKNLAKNGVVIVTINYRLGPLGFLSHPLLSKESGRSASGNYGLLDQIAALKWVKQNIADFGGNPDNVTIFGESAGGACVCDLMVSPLADGLFQQAVSESGSFSDAYPSYREDTVAKAEGTGLELQSKLGCDGAADPLAAMRSKTADEVVRAAYLDYSSGGASKYRPVVDGWVIPDNPWTMFSAGKQVKVPLLIGTNADEGSIFLMPDPKVLKMSRQDYESYVKSLYPRDYEAVLTLFPASDSQSVLQAMIKLRTIMNFSAGALHAADTAADCGSKVYMYQFSRVPNTMLKLAGAFHGLEIFYLFGNLRADRVAIPDDRTDLALSKTMMQYWTNFAKTSDPNGTQLPQWPVYEAGGGKYIILDEPLTTSSGLYSAYYDLIKKVTPQ